jgi:hypothetical protein
MGKESEPEPRQFVRLRNTAKKINLFLCRILFSKSGLNMDRQPFKRKQ